MSSSPQPTAAPGAPTLIVRLDWGDESWGVRQHAADYLSDGSVIRYANHDAPPCGRGRPCGILEINTLTAPGLAALRSLLAEHADLLASPRDFKPTTYPGGPEVANTGVDKRFVLVGSAGDRYAVTTPGTDSPDGSDWVLGPDIERLDALADVMLHPDTMIGPEGLAKAWTTYQPAKMAVFIRTHTIAPKATPIVDLAGNMIGMPFEGPQPAEMIGSWPFDAAPDTFGMAFTSPDGRDGRCGFVDSADIEALTAVVPPGAGGTLAAGMLAEGGSWGSGSLAWDDKMAFGLRIVALLPEDVSASCADAYAY